MGQNAGTQQARNEITELVLLFQPEGSGHGIWREWSDLMKALCLGNQRTSHKGRCLGKSTSEQAL